MNTVGVLNATMRVKEVSRDSRIYGGPKPIDEVHYGGEIVVFLDGKIYVLGLDNANDIIRQVKALVKRSYPAKEALQQIVDRIPECERYEIEHNGVITFHLTSIGKEFKFPPLSYEELTQTQIDGAIATMRLWIDEQR